ncbi:MAG: tRNA lysidine(34) synthetase TilS [Alphaproteobacteria bacterium]|nr:tRNA lysidine(34) synthetase TilS [Alphaproteobacteria bacterium]
MTGQDFKTRFADVMQSRFADVKASDIAVAVSGGQDSMALAAALSNYFQEELLVITVDHGLRKESRAEAEAVSQIKNIQHKILTWAHDKKPDSRIQEQARKARYDLIFEEMQAQGKTHLFLGHHMNDQAETFLFRLAKGSGLDGLACMAEQQERDGIVLCRPFLSFEKEELVKYCDENNIPYIRDPSNENEDFARVRLRQSMDILAEEGLTAKRLAVTASRLAKAKEALQKIAEKAFDDSVLENETNRIVLRIKDLKDMGFEVLVRVVLKAVTMFGQGGDYGPRMEKVEALCQDILKQKPFRKRTLGGVVFELKVMSTQEQTLYMTAEELE